MLSATVQGEMDGVVVSAGPSSIFVISCCRVRFVPTWLASSSRSGHLLPDLALGKFDSVPASASRRMFRVNTYGCLHA